MVSLLVMVGGFDVGRAAGAGFGDRRRVVEFIGEFAAAWTRPLARGDGYGEDVLQSVEEHLGVRLPPALREAYLVLGKRTDLTARQDPLLSPGRLRVDPGGGSHRVPQGEPALRGVGRGCVRPLEPRGPARVRAAGG